MKTRKTLQDLLVEFEACSAAQSWAEGRTIEEAIAECRRGDWMLWLAQRLKVDHRVLTLAKGHCVNTVRHLMKDDRSIKAVDAAIAYGEGRIPEDELKEAAAGAITAAEAAYSVASYVSYAYYASAAAAADAAAAAADADAAAAAAAYYAAAAAAYCAAAAASGAARHETQKQTADICRKYIGQLIIDKVNEI